MGTMKAQQYQLLSQQLAGLIDNQKDFICNSAQCAALLFHSLDNVNWAGFYYLKNQQLVLGPFQGKPACTPIPLGKGVCGLAAAERQSIVVADVDNFADHIVCDSASRSEIVIPLIYHDNVVGVLDIDSDQLANFDTTDQQGLEKIVSQLLASSEVNEYH